MLFANRSILLSVCILVGVQLVGCGSSEQATEAPQEDPTRGVAYQTEPGPEDPDAPTEFTTTESGLQYRILRKGKGPKPGPRSTVFAHYAGWLEDGTKFDSSYDRGTPLDFPLKNVIGGWQEGLQLLNKGGMIELIIPPELGYKEAGIEGTIPPNATLHFKVELIEIF